MYVAFCEGICLHLSFAAQPSTRAARADFGGNQQALDHWATRYYETLELFFAEGRFAGKDQNIMANICCSDPDLVDLISPPDDYPYDPWFYLQYHLA